MRTVLAIATAALVSMTAVQAATSAPTQPYTGTDIVPYAWTEGMPGTEGLSHYQAALLLSSQASLPVVLDEVTTLVAVSWDGLTFVYDYQLNMPSTAGLDINAFKTQQLGVFCDGLKQMQTPGELDALRYRYLTSDGKTLVIDITGADCSIA